MIVTWLGHASLFLNAAGKMLLIDPWFVEPLDGKYRFPPSPYAAANSMPQPDFLVLTSSKAEHSHESTLSQLKRDTVTLTARRDLEPRLTQLQFNKVRWSEPWATSTLSPGLDITFVPGGAVVIVADGIRLFHGGEAVMSVDEFREVAKRFGPLDMAFLPFAGSDKQSGLQRFFDGLVGLQAKEASPFGASAVRLDEDFSHRATHAEALAGAMKLAHENGTHLAHLLPGDEWSPETGAINKGLSDVWSEDIDSLRRYAALVR